MLMHTYRLRREPKTWHLLLLAAAAVALSAYEPSAIALDTEAAPQVEDGMVSQGAPEVHGMMGALTDGVGRAVAEGA